MSDLPPVPPLPDYEPTPGVIDDEDAENLPPVSEPSELDEDPAHPVV